MNVLVTCGSNRIREEMAKSIDRFDLMSLFVRIAETGSLSAAGRSLNLSQPSVSRQLRELEVDLGTQLIMRSTHRLTLTDAGREFLVECRQLLDAWETVRERFRLEKEAIEGRIRVAVPSGLGQTVLADVAGSFVEQFPHVTIDWLLNDAPTDLIGDGIDVWVRVGRIADESLIVRGLWHIERVIVEAATDRRRASHPEQLVDQPAVALSPYVGARLELFGPKAEKYRLKPRVVVSTDNLFAAERLMAAGRGYSVLPLWLVKPSLDNRNARLLCPRWKPEPLPLSVAYPQSRYRPARHQLFIEHLRKELPTTGAGITPMEL